MDIRYLFYKFYLNGYIKYKPQESMSDKSQEELQRFTTVLMIEAYLPILLAAAVGANYVVCKIMGESVL